MTLMREGRAFVRRIRQFFGDTGLTWNQAAQQRATALGQQVDTIFARRRALKEQAQPQITVAAPQQQGQGGQQQGGR